MAEYWDIYNKDKVLTGKTRLRGDQLLDDEYHLVVMAWLRNRRGSFLLSRRSENKPGAFLWETPGGSALKGESSLEAVIREVGEEVGLSVDPIHARNIGSFRYDGDCGWFCDYWLFDIDIDICDVTCQEEEVMEVKWATKEELLTHIENDEFFNGQLHLEHLFTKDLL